MSAELRVDPLSGRPVVIAPERARRPGAAETCSLDPPSPEELESCPFCAGREDRTPPETYRAGDGPTGWGVRVVPNLYPALERQEVVVHAPTHARSLVELADDQLALVARAWQARAAAGAGYVHACVNEGRLAGASLGHSHSQLFWLPGPPPEVQRELGHSGSDCTVCSIGDPFAVAERDGVVLYAAPAGRVGNELLVAPVAHETDPWASARLITALQVASEGLRRLQALEGPSPMNLWLHAVGHWHLELVPRVAVFAGLELGAGIYVNPVRPEEAAARLRGVDG